MSLVGPSKPTLIVRFCPLLFELRKIPRRVSLKQSGKIEYTLLCQFCELYLPENIKYIRVILWIEVLAASAMQSTVQLQLKYLLYGVISRCI